MDNVDKYVDNDEIVILDVNNYVNTFGIKIYRNLIIYIYMDKCVK